MTQPHDRPPLRVAMVQFKPRKAAVDANIERVRERVEASAGVHDLLVFPEAALSG